MTASNQGALNASAEPHYGAGDNGNAVAITNNIDGTRSQTYAYDALNRLVTAQTGGTYSTSPAHCWGESFQYDNQTTGGAWGNLTAIGVSNTAYNGCTQEGFSQTVMANNQISGFSYDAAGNWTGPTGAGYAYDAENHLVATAGVAYTYDGDGERIEKSNGEMYWYTSGGEVLDETDLSGNLTSEYIFFGGARIARRDGSGNLFYYLADHLGSSREIVEAGATTPCYDADFYPFGGERAYTNTCQQNYKFTGKERDPESGLDDFSARFYGSWTGRFTSPDDPFVGWNLADPQSLNLYAYVQDNPINDVDPTGHMNPCEIVDGGSTTSCGFDTEESAGLAGILIEGVDSGISGGILTPGPDTEGMKANTAIQAAAQHNDTQNQAPQGQNSGSNATPPPPSTQPATTPHVVLFPGSDKETKQLQASWNYLIAHSEHARAILKTALGAGDLTIHPAKDKAFYDPRDRSINVDPNWNPAVQTTLGPLPEPTDVILGHELGHAAGAHDDGPNHMNNINENENPIRHDLGLPDRTKYESPGTAPF